jgi:hypothetical protein
VRCGATATVGRVCLKHWARIMAHRHLLNAKLGTGLLVRMELQTWRCAYSGEELVPGVNASLDHRIPVSQGGARTLDNVQWVSLQINRMKADLSEDEFIAACCRVAARHG